MRWRWRRLEQRSAASMAINAVKTHVRYHQVECRIARPSNCAVRQSYRVEDQLNFPSSENQWELRTERVVPCKRHHAYRVLVNNFDDLWWHRSDRSDCAFYADIWSGGHFSLRSSEREFMNAGTVFNKRPGWFFSITDAIAHGRPGIASMVARWSIVTTPRNDPGYSQCNRSTYSVTIHHFSESAYRRNISLGIERSLKDSADRFVRLCEERALKYN
jgi:hypothetical protein